jgi:Nif-specific regulatory protein
MIEADVRIGAATNQDLEELVRGGGFREDLYYRLNVIALFLPPLRDRGEDILPLASYFLQDIGARIHRPAKVFHPDAVELLLSHGWPGNIRELENAIEHAVVLARTPEVQVTDLPFNVQASRVVVRETLDVPASLDEAQRQFRQRHIRDALNRYGGNRTRAAEALGLQRTYLSRLIKELDIDDA